MTSSLNACHAESCRISRYVLLRVAPSPAACHAMSCCVSRQVLLRLTTSPAACHAKSCCVSRQVLLRVTPSPAACHAKSCCMSRQVLRVTPSPACHAKSCWVSRQVLLRVALSSAECYAESNCSLHAAGVPLAVLAPTGRLAYQTVGLCVTGSVSRRLRGATSASQCAASAQRRHSLGVTPACCEARPCDGELPAPRHGQRSPVGRGGAAP